VWSWGVIHHSANPANVLKEIQRVLRPGGRAITMVYYRGWWNYFVMEVIKELSQENIAVNCTACMVPLQSLAAATTGARYVSPFYNRIRDGETEEKFKEERTKLLNGGVIENSDFDPNNVIRETRTLLDEYPDTEIIAGSIRTPLDIKHAGLAGAHIVTVSLKILKLALNHFKTDDAVARFLNDFANWSK